nr:diguanylate cyclase [Luteibacter rhizovicinus]
MGASIGVTLFLPGDAYDRIVVAADSAMYDAKRSGKNRCVLG